MYPFTTGFVIFAGSLFLNNTEIFIVCGLLTGLAMLFSLCFVFGSFCAHNDHEAGLVIVTFGWIYFLVCLVIQGLSCVIANPILGRPIAFTPRGETFGITLALFIGVGLLILIIRKFVIYIIDNCCIVEHLEYENKECGENPENKECGENPENKEIV
mgnify:CR=1 FL=1